MKKQILKSALIAMASVGLLASGAMATEKTLQEILNDITISPENSTVNVATDALAYDSYWSIAGSGGAISTFVIEIAGLASTNTFGIFDTANPDNFITIFSGGDTNGSQSNISILADGSVKVKYVDTGIDFAGNNFGFFLGTTVISNGVSVTEPVFYSDTNLNSDNKDHMLAFQGTGDMIQILPYAAGEWGPSEYILAWEDLAYPGADADFNDLVVMVESVNPVPEPATMLLFGTGLAGLAAVARRRKTQA